ncbi:benzoate/H(+) symporter BenE family transporter [Zhihengliuella salsuginis]|uniref:Benzoate transporter n=1 Tax=Zhihengliuella salsuginis TaxID=578222 RepID=A0ABQ3GGU5_9MICC|nr:benzoate/H(+) symporter BenE family transporter [Zhihengliuella salsuginis]GHD05141.1 benzoate transporter [Zhihengliuella salsuginis]
MPALPSTAEPGPAVAVAPRIRLADASVSAIVAGFIAVAVSYAGPLLVVLEAAQQAGLTPTQTSSWVWAISIGSGLCCVVLSLFTRMPVMVAWSVPGAALLITALGDYSFAEAVGAYIVAGAIGLVLSVTGLFGWLIRLLPKPVHAAVLAGVLMPFVLQVAPALLDAPAVAGAVVVLYLAGRRFLPRFAALLALAGGVAASAATGTLGSPGAALSITTPELTAPDFTWRAILGIAIPLVMVTMAGQNGPGLAMMHTFGYPANDRLLLTSTSAASIVFAPFGAHALNLAAITAGIASGPDAHPDPARRYVAGVACGSFYIVFGMFGHSIVGLLDAVPDQLVTATAGVALLSALQGALSDTMNPAGSGAGHRAAGIEAAVITLLVTASGVAPFGIAAPLWGMLAGGASYLLLRRRG